MSKYRTLEEIFELQEKSIRSNRDVFLPEYVFIKDCIELLVNTPIDSNLIKKNDKKKLSNAFNPVYFTARSSLISATKLLLYGSPGDALACLRVSLEAIMCIEHMVVHESFDDFAQKLYLKGKDIDYSKLAKELDKRDKREKGQRFSIWKYLSKYGSHFGHSKLRIQYYKVNGKLLHRIGMGALDEMTAYNISSRISGTALYLVRVMGGFYHNYFKGALPDSFHLAVDQLILRHKRFVDESKEKVQHLKKEIQLPSCGN